MTTYSANAILAKIKEANTNSKALEGETMRTELADTYHLRSIALSLEAIAMCLYNKEASNGVK